MGFCNFLFFNSIVIVGMFWFFVFVGGGGGIIYLKFYKIMIFFYKIMCYLVICVSFYFMYVF